MQPTLISCKTLTHGPDHNPAEGQIWHGGCGCGGNCNCEIKGRRGRYACDATQEATKHCLGVSPPRPEVSVLSRLSQLGGKLTGASVRVAYDVDGTRRTHDVPVAMETPEPGRGVSLVQRLAAAQRVKHLQQTGDLHFRSQLPVATSGETFV